VVLEEQEDLFGDLEDMEVGEGAQEVDRVAGRVRKDPGAPSAEEVARHSATHLPYRSWCKHCVNGRGTAHPHVSQHNSKEGEVPTVGADYHYMGKEGEEGTVPMLALEDAPSKVIFDMVATAKGVNEYMVKRVVQCLDLLGHKRIILKSDQEPALVALLDEVKHRWGGEIIPELSIVQDSQGNGMIESGIRIVSGQIKGMKSSLEEHLGEIGSTHNCVAWMVEHAAFLVSMFGIGRDGKEPYKLLKGKSWHGVVYEFGEGVQFKPIRPKGRYKLDDEVISGIFLGIGRKTGEY